MSHGNEQQQVGSTHVVTEDGTTILVFDDPARSRFEAHLNDEPVGIIDYRVEEVSGHVVIAHSQTYPPMGGRGIASALTRFALGRIREDRGTGTVVLQCPFSRDFVAARPEFADLLVPPAAAG
ncbi:GNAT family N-acetyltransferase [Nakamurella sp. A5-74]|uniref:GNAT family N-acetyltransferase n=1 Tax=Nakamurella sp. A5-74 TaxID=3158264 RepID=A0AAU8DVR0_9ACTN